MIMGADSRATVPTVNFMETANFYIGSYPSITKRFFQLRIGESFYWVRPDVQLYKQSWCRARPWYEGTALKDKFFWFWTKVQCEQ